MEDDPEGALFLQSVLEQAGDLVIAAHRGKTAIEWLREPVKPDLVILDCALPDVDGLSICQAIKENTATAQIPVIIQTASAENASRINALQVGADVYLNKPVSAEDLLRAVNAIFAKENERSTPHQGILRIGGLELDPALRSVSFNNVLLEDVAEKRFRLLYLLALHSSQALERSFLISQLGCPHDRDREIDVLVSLLRKELIRAFSFNMIETVPGVGYRLRLVVPLAQASRK